MKIYIIIYIYIYAASIDSMMIVNNLCIKEEGPVLHNIHGIGCVWA